MNIDPWILSFSAVTVIVTIFMGFWAAKKSKTASDFFVAGRSVSVGWNASAISGEYLSAASFMGVAGMVMSSGYDALWYPVCYACGYLFLLLFIAGPLRRFGAYTIPDFAEGRYDSPIFRKIAVIFVMFIGFFYTMPQMKGAGVTLAYIFPGLPYWVGVALVGAVITLNVALGGMKGITLVQAFQYWAKMFAISVPIFVLMSVYGHYGKQLGSQNANSLKSKGWESVFVRIADEQTPNDLGDLLAETAAKTGLLPVHGSTVPLRSTVEVLAKNYASARAGYKPVTIYVGRAIATNQILHPAIPSMTLKQSVQVLAASLKTNGVAIEEVSDRTFKFFPAAEANQFTSISVPVQDTVRKPLPEKAPADAKWISPFGPLTTKAAKNANASPRWNLTSENRSALRDEFGNPPVSGIRKVLHAIGARFDKSNSNKTKRTQEATFAGWTNMPSNNFMRTQMSPLLAVSDLGDLLGKPVFLATNLNRAPITIEGSFQSSDEFVRYIRSTLSSNGIEIDINQSIHAVAASDWSRYKAAPENVNFVDDRLFTMFFSNAPPLTFIRTYGELTGKKPLLATDLPDMTGEFNVPYEVMMRHEALAGIEKKIASMGITIIPGSNKEFWAVPTSRIAQYQAPPINGRLLSLLYTYSLIIALVCGTAGLPHILVRFYTNPDGVAAKRTTMWVMILIGIFYVFPPVFGVMGRNLLPDLYLGAGSKGTDKVVLELPRILNERVPMLGSILSGITCAGAFAAFMSTFSGLLVSMTGALAHDVYGRILRPKSTPEQRMRMFKFGAVIIGGVAILLGMQVEQLEINFMVGQAFAIAAASYFPLLFMSVWWRGMTQKGAATGMLTGGLLALVGITLTSVSDIALKNSVTKGIPNSMQALENFWIAHPGIRILCEQPAIWAVPLAITLMIVVSKLTRKEVPSDVRMKMLVLHAPEKLGLKQEYIQEHQGMGH